MTLDTRVYVHDRIDPRALFIRCNQIIGAHEGIVANDQPGSIGNEPGQGLPAWLIVYYGDPLVDDGGHEDGCDGVADECVTPCAVRRYAEVSFDTAYGYRGENGEGCGDLHARYVTELGDWLDGKGVRWSWLNEWTGEVHEGREGLAALGGGDR